MKIEKAMKERVSHVNEYTTTTFSIAQWLSIGARREFEGLTFDSSWLPKNVFFVPRHGDELHLSLIDPVVSNYHSS